MVKKICISTDDFYAMVFQALGKIPIFSGSQRGIISSQFLEAFGLKKPWGFQERISAVAITFQGNGFSPEVVTNGVFIDDYCGCAFFYMIEKVW